ncbi:uncharacterized protein C7orf57 homolog [Melopsittacus undulatus]|uniref:uncharacterized protein C7orf57 homolog n=1 Tax=Melopsittacus undulatus TaxID=13146 RepID=UPI00146A76F3|nr:uncharacterized protein C7orf57 homolog [Melopsittacus undulatus]
MPLTGPEKSVTPKSPLPPTSQIPGLGDLANAPHEMPSRCRRRRIKEMDSAYVRLAKQGGQPDLLKHYTAVTSKSSPAAYAAPDWYLHCSNSPATNKPRNYVSSLPDYIIHREFKADEHCGNHYEIRRGPFDFDTKTVWQRDAENKEKAEKKKVKLPAIKPKYPSRVPDVSMSKEFSGKNKLSFPPISAQRKNEAVNFSKLISNGYGTDWLQQYTGRNRNIKETSENSYQSKDAEPSESESAPTSNESKSLLS